MSMPSDAARAMTPPPSAKPMKDDAALLDPKVRALRTVVDDLVRDLQGLAGDTGSAELADTVSDLRSRLAEPFLFVIVGEVKAGKSAFVNALLGSRDQEIAETAPAPKTDRITQVVFGEAHETVEINPHLRKVLFPAPILKEISIVDTPGTNTVLEHHQEITERFVPGSDLVVFVFEGKNPYRKSAWDFFGYIHADWRKKVVFVLQQVDLLSDEELSVNREGVADYARQRGIEDPVVFAVSAKDELAGRAPEDSGFGDLRSYIQEHITGGRAPVLKLENALETAVNVVDRIARAVDDRREQLAEDRAFRSEATASLDDQEGRSLRQVDLLTEALAAEYDRATQATRARIQHGLGFFALTRRTVLAMFSRESTVAAWLSRLATELEGELAGRLGEKLEGGVDDLAGSVHQMASELDARVEAKLQRERVRVRKSDELFGSITEKREAILMQLRDRLSALLKKDAHYLESKLFPEHVPFSPDLAAGGGLAALGVALTALTQGAVFDVTGGVLTTLGLAFAGVATRLRRSRLLRDFDQEVARGREDLTGRVQGQLAAYIRELRQKLEGNFAELDAHLEREAGELRRLDGRVDELRSRVETTAEDVRAERARR